MKKGKKRLLGMILAFALIFITGIGTNVQNGFCDWCIERGAEDDCYKLDEEFGDDVLYKLIISNYYSESVIEQILNDGYCLGYLQAIKDGGWIPQSFTPNSMKSSTNTQPTTQDNSNAEQPKNTETSKAETPITLDNSTAGNYVVTNADTSVFETASTSSTVKETYDVGTEVAVNGTMGKFYEITYADTNAYILTKNVATSEDYTNAWTETERVDATCTEDGSVTSTNSITGETKTDTITALGHDYQLTISKEPTCTEKGSNEYTCSRCDDTYTEAVDALGHTVDKWEVTKKAGLFTKGEKVQKCTVCGEVVNTEEIAQTCPMPLWSVIVIIFVIGAGVGFFIYKKKSHIK